MSQVLPQLPKNFFSMAVLVTGLLTGGGLHAQTYKAGVDTVFSWRFENSINILGRDPEYFPANIFGLPDSNGSYDTGSSNPYQICALGVGGEITVGFRDAVLLDGEGPDFSIFENAFFSPITKKIFSEPAIVSVSRDGTEFREFSFDSLTLAGCAGITPTNGDKDPYDPSESGGDSFDLKDIGMDSVRYIRIRDISPLVMKKDHPYYDPTISGFDLDAVLGLYLARTKPAEQLPAYEVRYRTNGDVLIRAADNFTLINMQLVSAEGKILISGKMEDATMLIEKGKFPPGIYFIILGNGRDILFTQKILL